MKNYGYSNKTDVAMREYKKYLFPFIAYKSKIIKKVISQRKK